MSGISNVIVKKMRMGEIDHPTMAPTNHSMAITKTTFFSGDKVNPIVDFKFTVRPIPGKTWTFDIPLESIVYHSQDDTKLGAFKSKFYYPVKKTCPVLDVVHLNANIADWFARTRLQEELDFHREVNTAAGATFDKATLWECIRADEIINEVGFMWRLGGACLKEPAPADVAFNNRTSERNIVTIVRGERDIQNYWSKGVHGLDYCYFVLKFIEVKERTSTFQFTSTLMHQVEKGEWSELTKFYIPQYVAMYNRDRCLPLSKMAYSIGDRKFIGKQDLIGVCINNPMFSRPSIRESDNHQLMDNLLSLNCKEKILISTLML